MQQEKAFDVGKQERGKNNSDEMKWGEDAGTQINQKALAFSNAIVRTAKEGVARDDETHTIEHRNTKGATPHSMGPRRATWKVT